MKIFKRGIAAVGQAGLVATLVAGLVVACGGGGGGSSFAGIDRLGVSTGTITGFGSIIVNGVHYEVNGQTEFDIDDTGTGSQDDLKVGQQVTIQWSSLDDGVTRRSETVSYDDTAEGPIASIDLLNQSLVVLGQVVLVDAATSFDDNISPRDLTGLSVGDFVEVSGLIDSNGAVRATRVERVNQGDDGLEVRGVIESLDTIDETFILNGLIVDYSQITNPPALANGLFVEVEGDNFDSGTGTLIADKVEPEDDGISGADDGDDGEVEGYITRYASATDFDVAGARVTTNAQTVYENGVVGDLLLNVKVEVEGEVNASGVIVARKVEFKSGDDDDDGDDDSADGYVVADVTAVNAGAGTVSLAGVTVTVTAETRYEDQSAADDRTFGIADINVGDTLEVRGDPGAGATLTASIVERDDASDEGLLRGPVSLIANPSLSVLGVPVITDGSTEFRDNADNALDNAAFFASLTDGSEVQVKFIQGGGTIVADEIELEDED
jgi:hypothetical protein